MGETCTFSESGTSVAKFCENSCCDNKCCTDDVDTKALAIAIAVILAVLLLIALIILIIYCCLKRNKSWKNKTDWRHKDMALTELQPNKTRKRQANGIVGPYRKVNMLIQTSDPNPVPGDHILWGKLGRYTSVVKPSKTSPKRSPWDKENQPMDGFTQTQEAEDPRRQTYLPVTLIREEPLHEQYSPSSTMFITEFSDYQTKGVQTAASNRHPPDVNKVKPPKKQYLSVWTPTAPWRPSAQAKSLSNDRRKSIPNENHVIPDTGPFYPVHKCAPESSLDSERSGSRSVT